MSDYRDVASWCEFREPARQFSSYDLNGQSAVVVRPGSVAFSEHRCPVLGQAMAREVIRRIYQEREQEKVA